VFDAGEVFGIMQVEEVEEEEDEAAWEVRRKQPNPGSELCYKVIVTRESGLQAHARQQLQQVPGLLHRMANLMGIEFHGELPSAEAVALVLEEMWKFNQTYQLAHGTAEEKMPVWYIMDEFGSRIQHADVPSFATAPFFYMPQQVAYTLLWPLRDLDTGEEVTRDFAYGETDPLIRKASRHCRPPLELAHLPPPCRKLSQERPGVLLNQFPCENLLTVKDCLASIARRAGGPEGPPWLPRTFNLRTELPQFVSYFQQRERWGEDNHWICKPWNLARSLDTHVTKSLHSIIRHRESTPKVGPAAQEPQGRGDQVSWSSWTGLGKVHCEEFIPEFEKQYPEFPWTDVQAEIFRAFTELFQVACAKPPPLGLCDYPSSRAMYAVDLMLKWDNGPD
uniref:Tubulin--tyrosine ligase-like protein 12 SET-like domain-containing protein n=1 Tax=Colobus angolensis palliatus TaxID=336983 RepID=A0A2K5ID21_COLAP